MKERYNRVFSDIAPKQSDEELYQTVIRKAEATMKKRTFSKKAIALPVAAALTLTLGAAGVTAALNADYLRSLFGANESITEKIHNSIFEDSDGHLLMTAEEYVSDGQCAYLTLHYQALDEEGAQWLAAEDFMDENYYTTVQLHPVFKKSTEIFYATSYGTRMIELKSLRTDSDRYFTVSFEANDRHYGTEQAELHYTLTDGAERSTCIDFADNVNSEWFELNADRSPSSFYTPKYLVLSDMSFTICGENQGAYADNSIPGVMWSFTSLMTNEEANADASNDIRFVLEDGSEYTPSDIARLSSAVAHEENRYTDINIASGTFMALDRVDEEGFEMRFEDIDADNIIGLWIGHVYYELERE